MFLRLLIADDNEGVRLRLRTLIESRKPDWEICAEVEDGGRALAKSLELTPDVAILDFSMRVMSGIQAAIEIRRLRPSIKILLLSAYDLPALQDYVDACLDKADAGTKLVDVIERLAG